MYFLHEEGKSNVSYNDGQCLDWNFAAIGNNTCDGRFTKLRNKSDIIAYCSLSYSA